MKPATALIASAALLTTGVWLLHSPAAVRPTSTHPTAVTTTPPRATAQPIVPARTSPQPVDSTYPPSSGSSGSADATPSPPGAAPTAETGVLAPADGPAADPTIQAMLEHSAPGNLPTPLEQQLALLGRKVWLADVTGAGRARWPAYFTSPGSSGYTHVRVQAAIARRTGTGTVTVTLLWAGTSPGGDVQVGLPGSVLLLHRADGTWEPTR